MAFEIEWSERSEKALSKLPKLVASRIVKKVDGIKENPFTTLSIMKVMIFIN